VKSRGCRRVGRARYLSCDPGAPPGPDATRDHRPGPADTARTHPGALASASASPPPPLPPPKSERRPPNQKSRRQPPGAHPAGASTGAVPAPPPACPPPSPERAAGRRATRPAHDDMSSKASGGQAQLEKSRPKNRGEHAGSLAGCELVAAARRGRLHSRAPARRLRRAEHSCRMARKNTSAFMFSSAAVLAVARRRSRRDGESRLCVGEPVELRARRPRRIFLSERGHRS